MKWRKANSFFSFTRSEREGVISLLVLLLLAAGVKRYVNARKADVPLPSELQVYEYIHELEQQEKAQRSPRNSPYKKNKEHTPEAYFRFDPNTLDDQGWVALGLSNKQVESLRKYQSYGAHFSEKENLRKVYVLDSLWLTRHWDDIEIKLPEKESSQNTDEYTPQENAEVIETPAVQLVELNAADTLSLQAVSGIGAYSARKIFNFRDALGGFNSTEQLQEVYGLHPDTYLRVLEMLTVNPSLIEQKDINRLDADSLRQHPYISWKVANAIVKYREHHGDYSDINDLKELYLISDSLFLKLKPYLSTGHDH